MKLSPQLQDAYDQLKDEDWTYEQVAEKAGIDPEKFEYLMKNRFDGHEDKPKEGKAFHLSYTLEWAERVRDNPFIPADEETTEVLNEAGYQKSRL